MLFAALRILRTVYQTYTCLIKIKGEQTAVIEAAISNRGSMLKIRSAKNKRSLSTLAKY